MKQYTKEELISKYKEKLKIVNQNLAESIDTNTDIQNDEYFHSIKLYSEIIRDLSKLTWK